MAKLKLIKNSHSIPEGMTQKQENEFWDNHYLSSDSWRPAAEEAPELNLLLQENFPLSFIEERAEQKVGAVVVLNSPRKFRAAARIVNAARKSPAYRTAAVKATGVVKAGSDHPKTDKKSGSSKASATKRKR